MRTPKSWSVEELAQQASSKPIFNPEVDTQTGTTPHPNSQMEHHGISDYCGSHRHPDNPVGGELHMTVPIIQFTDCQDPSDLAPVHADIETRLVDLNRMAAEIFHALMIDMATGEYGPPEENPRDH